MSHRAHIATLRCYDSLNDFLKSKNRGKDFEVRFNISPSAKDLIESAGVPHTEVAAVTINGCRSTLQYNVRSGDRIDVYPRSGEASGREDPDGKTLPHRFVADIHLGKLVRLLRLTGVDTAYSKTPNDKQIVECAVREQRGVLTRDIELLKHGELDFGFGYWLRSTDPDSQILEVIDYFELHDHLAPFTRCLSCNGNLKSVSLQNVSHRVPENVRAWCTEYVQCNRCNKVYWKGSHYDKLQKKVGKIFENI